MSDKKMNLHEGLSLSIRRKNERIRFKSRVTDVKADYFAINLLDLPLAKQQLITSGDEVRGTLTRYDAIYHFKTTIMEVVQESHLRFLRMHNPDTVWREQRRQYFRVEHRLPIALHMEYLDKNGQQRHASIKGNIVNISAGGVKILADIPEYVELVRGAHVLLDFSIEEFTFKELLGEILRIEEAADKHLFALIFIDPEMDTQNTITRLNILYERRHILGGLHE
ncbi:MAG: PilZ domain-containing protein [Candidatus Delongbacteria bacterium]|nr:PilZ domain-containing protein [Candidatus Delongbacteria bacterium]